MHVQAGHRNDTVMEAYCKAAGFAEESGNLKHQVYTRLYSTCTCTYVCMATLLALIVVGCCLATKVFIGKLLATREAWVIVE